MACGDRYLHLLVTAKGYTPENPWGAVLIISDYGEWHDLAGKMVSAVNVHMATLQAVEAREGLPLPEFNRLSAEWSALLSHYDALPSFLLVVSESKTQRAKEVAIEAACVLEQIDAAIESYGEKPPVVPGPGRAPKAPPEKTFWNVAGDFALVAGLVLGGYLLFKHEFGGGGE